MAASSSTWRLLVTPDQEPAFNMALDEALLLLPDSPPTIRFYTWQPAAISLGWFQDAAEVEPLPERVKLVRRITGGLAIHHYCEFTWSVVVRENFFPGPVEDSYLILHAALIKAIHNLGSQGVHLRDKEKLLSEGVTDSPWCFERSSSLDLVAWGRKLAGSAQRRTGHRLLHHGSLPLAENPLTPASTWVSHLVGKKVGFTEMGHAFSVALEEQLGIKLVPGKLAADEYKLANELVMEKHASDGHIRRKVPKRRPGGCGIENNP